MQKSGNSKDTKLKAPVAKSVQKRELPSGTKNEQPTTKPKRIFNIVKMAHEKSISN